MGCRMLWILAAIGFILGCRQTVSPPENSSPAGLLIGHADATPTDVVLITVDTLRADATGFSGSGKVRTPHLDRLAGQGVVFTFAHAHAVTTLPSHCSIFTGLYPYQHGVRDNAGFVLGPDIPTLATILKAEGYRTGAFISSAPLDARYGLNRGFDTYDDHYQGFGKREFVFDERPGEVTVQKANRWFESQKGHKRFLWIHIFTPHFPYEPLPPFDVEYKEAPYYGEAASADAQLAGFLVPFLENRSEPALIVLTSDHGEGLGEHGELTHGTFAYESTLKIPLVVWAPHLIKPGVSKMPARHIDLLPTSLHLLGMEFPQSLPGRSLFQRGGEESDSTTYFEALMTHLNHGWAPLVGLIDEGYKSIHLPNPEIYHLPSDPMEKDNLIDSEGARFGASFRQLPEDVGVVLNREFLSEEEIEQLQALGYAAANIDPTRKGSEAIDPKDMVRADMGLKLALKHHHEGSRQAAVEILSKMVDEYPSFEPAYRDLSSMLQEMGREDEAVALLSKAVDRGLDTEAMTRLLAQALVRTGRFLEARNLLSQWSDSLDPETQSLLGKAFAGLGQGEKAEAAFKKALDLDPTNPDAHGDFGVLLLSLGRAPEAEVQFRAAVAQDPTKAQAWNGLGIIAARAGDRQAALDSFSQAITKDPSFVDGYLNLGRVFLAMGENAKAAEVLEKGKSLADPEKRRIAEQLLAKIPNP